MRKGKKRLGNRGNTTLRGGITIIIKDETKWTKFYYPENFQFTKSITLKIKK